MNTSLSKARAGVFLLLIAISLYSLFMISASNNSYAAGQSLFKFSSLIGLSPSANGYDRQAFRSNNLAENLITSADDIKIDVPKFRKRGAGISSFDAGDVAKFLSSPRKSKFRSRNLVAGSGAGENGNGSDIIASNLLLDFNGASGGVNSGLVSQCIRSLQPDPDTEELIVEQVIACIINGGGDGNLLADGNNPFGNGGNGIDDPNSNGNGNGAGDPNSNGNGGNGAGDPNANGNGGNGAGDPNANNGNGDPNDPNGNGGNGDPVVLATVPEPSTYMLFGLGLIGLVGFSRKQVKARIS